MQDMCQKQFGLQTIPHFEIFILVKMFLTITNFIFIDPKGTDQFRMIGKQTIVHIFQSHLMNSTYAKFKYKSTKINIIRNIKINFEVKMFNNLNNIFYPTAYVCIYGYKFQSCTNELLWDIIWTFGWCITLNKLFYSNLNIDWRFTLLPTNLSASGTYPMVLKI